MFVYEWKGENPIFSLDGLNEHIQAHIIPTCIVVGFMYKLIVIYIVQKPT